MSFTMKVDMPNLSPGEKVQVHGLGMLENGKTIRISDEQAATFRAMTGRPVTENGRTSFAEGDDLDEVNFPEGITVTRDQSEKKEVSS